MDYKKNIPCFVQVHLVSSASHRVGNCRVPACLDSTCYRAVGGVREDTGAVIMVLVIWISCLYWLDYLITRKIVKGHNNIGMRVFEYGGSVELNPYQVRIVEGGEVWPMVRDFVLLVLFYSAVAFLSEATLLFFAGLYIYPLAFALLSGCNHLIKLQGIKRGGISGRVIYSREYVLFSTVASLWCFLALCFVVRPLADLYTIGGMCGGLVMSIIITSGAKS